MREKPESSFLHPNLFPIDLLTWVWFHENHCYMMLAFSLMKLLICIWLISEHVDFWWFCMMLMNVAVLLFLNCQESLMNMLMLLLVDNAWGCMLGWIMLYDVVAAVSKTFPVQICFSWLIFALLLIDVWSMMRIPYCCPNLCPVQNFFSWFCWLVVS